MKTRTCTSCGGAKPATLDYFHRYKGGLHARCKPCRAIIRANSYRENREREIKKKREYARKNRYISRASKAKRRARKLNATPPWLTNHQLSAISQRYRACGPDQHVDHIVPLQGTHICGLHVPWNLQIISVEENLSKSNKYHYWWLTDTP